MAVGRHFENGFIAITQPRESSDFSAIKCAAASYASKDDHTTKCHNFANSTWQTASIVTIVFRLYLDDLFSD